VKTLLRTVALIVLASCTFNSDEVYFKEIVVPVVEGTLAINVDSKNDTILIYKPTTFSVDFTANVGRIERVEVFLKDGLHATLRDPGQSFTIGQYDFRTGVFDLRLKMTVDPQTGSITNRNGGERTVVERTYKLKIDADPPAAPVLQTSNENGFLKISWTPYTKPNFVSYRLSISTPNNSTRNVTITNPAATTFIDSAYTGGYTNTTTYYITTNAIGSVTRSVSSSHPLLLTHTYSTNDSIAKLTWRKMPFTKAFAEYIIKENNVERMRIQNPADTSVLLKINAVLNMQTTIQVQVLPKYPHTQYPATTHQRVLNNTVRGKQLPSNINTLVYNETFQNFFARRQPANSPLYTVRFDRDFNAIDSVNIRGVIPFKGSHLYYGTLNTVNRREWLSGTVESASTNTTNITPSVVAAGSTGMVVATWQTPRTATQPPKYYSRLIHIPTATDAWDVLTFNTSHTAPRISTDSKYIHSLSQGVIAQLSGTAYSIFTTFGSNTSLALMFRPENEEEMMQTNLVEGLRVYNPDLTIKRTITAPEPGYSFESYDAVTKNVLFAKSDSKTLYAINIDTGEVKTITAYKGSGISYTLINGYLISGNNYFKIF
jgi:hypothetical protein